jgi:hypothetical protein
VHRCSDVAQLPQREVLRSTHSAPELVVGGEAAMHNHPTHVCQGLGALGESITLALDGAINDEVFMLRYSFFNVSLRNPAFPTPRCPYTLW